MKSVLMSIRPKVFRRIEEEQKTIVIRKTRPKIETPFRVFVYLTKPGLQLDLIIRDGEWWLGEIHHGSPLFIKNEDVNKIYTWGRTQKIYGEFVCDYINPFFDDKDASLTPEEIKKYGKGKPLYGWHISDLKIYDKPRELSEFWSYNEELHERYDSGRDFCCYDGTNEYGESLTDCGDAYNNILNCYRCWEEWSGWCHHVTRPPQSWCYVEEGNQ